MHSYKQVEKLYEDLKTVISKCSDNKEIKEYVIGLKSHIYQYEKILNSVDSNWVNDDKGLEKGFIETRYFVDKILKIIK